MVPFLPTNSRLPRFRRSVERAGRFVLTERDEALLKLVFQHRFLSSAHLVRLAGGSAQPVLRRLQLLYHHGFLDRPRSQLDYYHQGGSRPMVYGLGGKGARQLGVAPGRFEERQVGRLHLQHTLRVADVLVGLEVACRGRREFLAEAALREDLPPGRQFHWAVAVRHQGEMRRVGLIPDGVFALRDAVGRRVLCFVEADRGTMPVSRRSLAQSSFLRKLLAYGATWEQGLHGSRFGVTRFRVLTVTSSPSRARRLVEACGELGRGRGLFLFTDQAAFLAAADPFTLEWLDGHGGASLLTP